MLKPINVTAVLNSSVSLDKYKIMLVFIRLLFVCCVLFIEDPHELTHKGHASLPGLLLIS